MRREHSTSPGIAACTATLRALGCCVAIVACSAELPPKPAEQTAEPSIARPKGTDSAPDSAGAQAWLEKDATAIILTYAADRGHFKDTSVAEDVPPEAKGLVKVALLEGPRPPAGQVWVTNLAELESPDARAALRAIPRVDFEELALGNGRKSAIELPSGLELPDIKAASEGIIVYKTEWCGVCKKLTAYLDKKGVAYTALDIEKDKDAAAELKAKASAKGMSTGSVPVIDVKGELIVGFDRRRLEALLDG